MYFTQDMQSRQPKYAACTVPGPQQPWAVARGLSACATSCGAWTLLVSLLQVSVRLQVGTLGLAGFVLDSGSSFLGCPWHGVARRLTVCVHRDRAAEVHHRHTLTYLWVHTVKSLFIYRCVHISYWAERYRASEGLKKLKMKKSRSLQIKKSCANTREPCCTYTPTLISSHHSRWATPIRLSAPCPDVRRC